MQGRDGQAAPQYTAPSGRSYAALPDTAGVVAKARARAEAEPDSVEGGEHEKARTLAARVTPDLQVDGNSRLYFHRLLFYQGRLAESALPSQGLSDIEVTTLAYGVGAFRLIEGDTAAARRHFERAVSTGAWPALAFIAAEHELSGGR
jgi:hypothetical protein